MGMPDTGITPLRSFQSHGALNALSASPGKDRVVIAGREVLKVLYVDQFEVKEVANLRTGGKINLNYSSSDVKWSPEHGKNILATAATNGAVVIWDLARPIMNKQERVINEHLRTVNRISFHPTANHLLLSASQDTTMKLWDLRENSMARFTFKGMSSLRDVRFNPIKSSEFAAALENGNLQIWDIRSPNQPATTITAHNGLVLSLDWFGDGCHIATGGRDKLIKVWDVSQSHQQPMHTIETFSPVARLEVRPPEGSQSAQIASSSLVTDDRIQVWDIGRPYIPKYTLNVHLNLVTGFLWVDSNIMWSCSKDKSFIQQDIRNAHLNPENRPEQFELDDLAYMDCQLNFAKTCVEPIKLLPKSSLCWSLHGDLTFSYDAPTDVVGNNLMDDAVPISDFIPTPTSPVADSQSHTHSRHHYLASPFPSFSLSPPLSFFRPGTSPPAIALEPEQTVPVSPRKSGGDRRDNQKIVVDVYKARILSGHIVTESFDPSAFIFIAQEYILSGLPGPALCIHNARVARLAGKEKTSKSWQILNIILENTAALNSNVKFPQSFENWKYLQVVGKWIDDCCKSGDIQMAASMILILRGHENGVIYVGVEQEEQIISAYIDLLQRYRLWTPANQVIQLSIAEPTRSLNQLSTTYNTSCSSCQKALTASESGYWGCKNCKTFQSPCSICHEIVRGAYAWCSGCGHGGHIGHLEDWFNESEECPTGCGHLCLRPTT